MNFKIIAVFPFEVATVCPSRALSWEHKRAATPACADSDWSSISVNVGQEGRSIACEYPAISAG